MRVLRLHSGSVAASSDNVVNLVIPKNGRIRSIRWTGYSDVITDNATLRLQLSLNAASQMSVNNTVGVIDMLQRFHNGTAGTLTNLEKQVLVDIPVAQGETVYLHANIGGTITSLVDVFIDIAD